MSHQMTISCECGATITVPTALRDDQTMIGNTAMVDTVLGFVLPTIDDMCTCDEGDPQWVRDGDAYPGASPND